MKKSLDHSPDRDDIGWLCASDIMQHDVVTVRTSDSLEEVERVLADAKVSGVPVLGAEDRVVGVLSTSDLVDRYANDTDPIDMPVGNVDEDGEEVTLDYAPPGGGRLCAADVMTPDIESIPPDTNVREVARRMVDSQIHRLLVVDRDRLVGIVSTIDILRALAAR